MQKYILFATWQKLFSFLPLPYTYRWARSITFRARASRPESGMQLVRALLFANISIFPVFYFIFGDAPWTFLIDKHIVLIIATVFIGGV